MRQALATLLAEDMGEIRDDYSGRGMYGDNTFAVVFDCQSDFQNALVFAAYAIGRDDSPDSAEDDLQALSSLRLDSMGLGIVVY